MDIVFPFTFPLSLILTILFLEGGEILDESKSIMTNHSLCIYENNTFYKGMYIREILNEVNFIQNINDHNHLFASTRLSKFQTARHILILN